MLIHVQLDNQFRPIKKHSNGLSCLSNCSRFLTSPLGSRSTLPIYLLYSDTAMGEGISCLEPFFCVLSTLSCFWGSLFVAVTRTGFVSCHTLTVTFLNCLVLLSPLFLTLSWPSL